MKKVNQDDLVNELHHLEINGFAYELIRETLLPDLLGKEFESILYWAGKNLARKFPLQTKGDILTFFRKAAWGELSIVKETKDSVQLELSSDLISNRLERVEKTSFYLEAGFLAEQFQNQQKLITEATAEQKRKAQKVIFIVKWDNKDTIV